jgi:hypothetical protein
MLCSLTNRVVPRVFLRGCQVFACGKGEYTGLGGRADVLIPLLLDAFDGVPVKQVSPI